MLLFVGILCLWLSGLLIGAVWLGRQDWFNRFVDGPKSSVLPTNVRSIKTDTKLVDSESNKVESFPVAPAGAKKPIHFL